jgi:uncharacterized repeat protein (TIGR01451 family)
MFGAVTTVALTLSVVGAGAASAAAPAAPATSNVPPVGVSAAGSPLPGDGSGSVMTSKRPAHTESQLRPNAASPLDCTGSTIYSLSRGTTDGRLFALQTSTVGGLRVTSTLVSTIPGGGTTDGLGITPGGTGAYVVDQTASGSVNVHGYVAATDTWTTYPGTNVANAVAGAVDPANGVYYYASYSAATTTVPSTATIAGFDTNTNTAIPGIIGTVTLPLSGVAGNSSGDFVFDASGNLYIVNTIGTATAVSVVAGPLPTTGSATGVPLSNTTLTTFNHLAVEQFNGAAFDNSGHLFLGFVALVLSRVVEVNPATGATIAGPTLLSLNAQTSPNVDLGACSLPPSLTLRKDIAGRVDAGDQFGLSITGGGITGGNTSTTSGTSTGVQTATAGPVITSPATSYTVAETAASGDLANYVTTYACVDVANGDSAVASGSDQSFVLPFPSTPAGGVSPNVVCTFTNTPLAPSLSMEKSATPSTIHAAGQTVSYAFVVTNTGNVTLTNVNVTETGFSGSGPAPVVTCPAAAASLAPAASVTCTASYDATQADIDAGRITNAASASGTPPTGPVVTSPPSRASVTVAQAPSLTLAKSVAETTLTAAGQVLHYSFLVTNVGNLTLTNIGIVETMFSGSGTGPVATCPVGAASLAPAATVTCTATYTTTQADVESGNVTNTATAHGSSLPGPGVISPPSSARVPNVPVASLSVVKSASPLTITKAGDSIAYSFLVTNTGGATLANVAVTDTAFSGTGTTPVVTCPAGADSLAPAASVTCTATYVATQADIDAGAIRNAATATGTPPTGPAVTSPASRATVTARQHPSVKLVKSVGETALTAAGQVLHYSFLITNNGNVTLTTVRIKETAFTGTGARPTVTCPAGAGSLAPGATLTCTASYTVTHADIYRGTVKNTAVATGKPPHCPRVTSRPSSTSVGHPHYKRPYGVDTAYTIKRSVR